MIQLTIDDEARALSAWAHTGVLYVGEDVIFAPCWATHVCHSLVDGHLYFVGPSDLAEMPLGINADTRELY